MGVFVCICCLIFLIKESFFGLFKNWVLLKMLSMTSHNLEFGRSGLDFVACGCSSNASYLVRNSSKGVLRRVKYEFGARKWLCFRREFGSCRVVSTKTPEAFVNGIAILWIVFVCLYCF